MKDSSPYYIEKRGQLDIGIDFNSQIYNFKNYHCINEFYIYNCDKYSIVSSCGWLQRNNPDFFTTSNARVIKNDTNEEILLEDYAFEWITNPERDISIFDSKDFLEQACITHSIWRIQDSNSSIEPFNDYLREVKKDTDKITNSILRILETKIKEVVKKFNFKYKHINYSDTYSKASEIVLNIIIGENKKHIEQTLHILNTEPDKKQKVRSEFRKHSIHTVKNYKNKTKEKIDLTEIQRGAVEKILKSFNPNKQLDVEMAIRLLQPENFSAFVAETLSYNSSKIYRVSNKENLKDFIFGKEKSFIPLYDYLEDYFKNDIKKYKKGILMDYTDDFNDYAEDNSDYNLLGKPKKWKSNQNNYTQTEFENIKNKASEILKGKQLNVYLKWLNNSYDSRNQNERQNLLRAKKVIKKLKIDIPLPISQK